MVNECKTALRRASPWVLSLLVVGLSATLHAQAPGEAPEVGASPTPSDASVLEARSLFEEGVRLSRAERWLEALDVFRRSAQLVDRPRTQFNMAIALDRLGRLRESIAAIDRYLALSDPAADEADRLEAARVRLACERRLVTLVLRITPTDASVEVDGDAVAGEGAERRLTWDPGDHVVAVRRAGHVAFRETLSLPPGSLVDRTIVLEVDPAAALPTVVEPGPEVEPVITPIAPPQTTSLVEDPIFWVVVGLVVVGVGAGVGVGVQIATEPQPYGGTTGLRF